MPLKVSSVFPENPDELRTLPNRSSVVHSTKGIVACTQPLAAQCGIEILRSGGNCADAAVAVAAGMNVTEPASTGIGGDMFCLFYDAKTQKISALNGSGRAGVNYTLNKIRGCLDLADGVSGYIPKRSPLSVTVPGAAAGWCDVVERFGSGNVDMGRILAPAIELGEKGFPVSEIASYLWKKSEKLLREASPNFKELLKDDPSQPDGSRVPRPGEIMKNPCLAKTFRTLATEGRKGFYKGRIAESIVDTMKEVGGLLELEDLSHHLEIGSEPVDPISLKFRGQGLAEKLRGCISGGCSNEPDLGLEIWEHPPNGQGIVALMALGIIEELERTGKIPIFKAEDHNKAPYLHVLIESLRIAFADGNWFVTDPNVEKVPTGTMISRDYLAERAKLFDPSKAADIFYHGSPAMGSSDTVYFACSDAHGNAISFINSNYSPFGTGIIPRGCGFVLQNRGKSFRLDQNDPNIVAPGKRPYHTIIPAAVTNLHDGSLHSVFGVMGGYMQPQGHVQVLLGQIVGALNPQQAIDAPRFCLGSEVPGAGLVVDKKLYLEAELSGETARELQKMGHEVEVLDGMEKRKFGKGQVIRRSVDDVEDLGVWSAASDLRGDGAAYPV